MSSAIGAYPTPLGGELPRTIAIVFNVFGVSWKTLTNNSKRVSHPGASDLASCCPTPRFTFRRPRKEVKSQNIPYVVKQRFLKILNEMMLKMYEK